MSKETSTSFRWLSNFFLLSALEACTALLQFTLINRYTYLQHILWITFYFSLIFFTSNHNYFLSMNLFNSWISFVISSFVRYSNSLSLFYISFILIFFMDTFILFPFSQHSVIVRAVYRLRSTIRIDFPVRFISACFIFPPRVSTVFLFVLSLCYC